LKLQAENPITSIKKFTNLGKHVLAELYNCDPNVLNNAKLIEKFMVEAAVVCGATVVEKNFHMFSPYGVSGVVIISDSHLAIHTCPEYGYAAVDLFTCGDSCDPLVAYEYLKKQFNAGSSSYSELKRGMLNTESNKVIETPFQLKEAGTF